MAEFYFLETLKSVLGSSKTTTYCNFLSYLSNCTKTFYQTRSSGQSKRKSVSARTKTFELSLHSYCLEAIVILFSTRSSKGINSIMYG